MLKGAGVYLILWDCIIQTDDEIKRAEFRNTIVNYCQNLQYIVFGSKCLVYIEQTTRVLQLVAVDVPGPKIQERERP